MITMSLIDLTQSSYNTPTFSFEDALYAFTDGYDPSAFESTYPSIILFSAGCLVNSSSSNCTAACQDPSLIFTNPYTLQNCMVLASLGPTKPNANGSLTLYDHLLSPLSAEVASNFSIYPTDPNFAKLSSDVNETISECLQQYCDISRNCVTQAPACSVLGDNLSYNQTYQYCYTDICQPDKSISLDPDIGGIGVRRLILVLIMKNLLNLSRYTYLTGCKLVSLFS